MPLLQGRWKITESSFIVSSTQASNDMGSSKGIEKFVPVQRVILKAERSFEPDGSWPREKLEPPASLKAPRTLSFLLPMRRSAKEKSLSA